MVADELYGVRVPIVQLGPRELDAIPDGASVTVEEGGEVTLQ